MSSPGRPISITAICFSPMLFLVLIGSLSQVAYAQEPGKPVPRLLTHNVDPTGSRPRLVGPGGPSIHEGNSPSASLLDATDAERSAFEKTNQSRLDNGLTPLTWDTDLCRLARAHSESMARIGYFDHETPEGLQLKDRARALGVRFKVIGENIAYNKGYSDPGAFAVERWMRSGGHRANILYAGFQSSAIGSYISSDGSVYLTQVFVTR